MHTKINEGDKVDGYEMHTLSGVLNKLMAECDVDDAKLSRQTGIPASTISRMRLNSNANPTASTLRPIAKFFDISICQLLGDEPLAMNRLPGTHNPDSFTATLIPILEWNSVTPWLKEGKILNQHQHTANHWLSSEHEVSKQAFALTITTETFGLFLRKGTLVLIEPEMNPKDGDIVALQFNKENCLSFRQILMDGSLIYVRSINPEIKSTTLLQEGDQIFGVIIETRFQLQEPKPALSKAENSKKSLISCVRNPIFTESFS